MTDPSELLALETRRGEAIGACDLAALAEVLADDYLHVLGNGRVIDKAQYLEMIRKGPRKPERGRLEVRVFGEAAVIAGDLDNHIGPSDGERRVIHTYCTQVARREDGRWRFVSCILTRKRDQA